MKNARPQTAESSALDKRDSNSPCDTVKASVTSYQINAHFRYYKARRSDPRWASLPGHERYGVLTAEIRAKCPPKRYQPHPRFRTANWGRTTGYVIDNTYPYRDEKFAERCMEQLRNVVRFADLTGLTPSNQCRRERELRNIICRDPWDHATVWHDDHRNLVLTNEPYPSDGFPAWCAANGWRYVLLPEHIGTYWPGVTLCFIAAPPGSTADLDAIAQRLIAGWAI